MTRSGNGDKRRTIKVSKIRYSQGSISNVFSDGRYIHDTIDALKSGQIKPSDIPLIRVGPYKTDQYITFDNRRLFCFKVACIDEVSYTIRHVDNTYIT